MHRRLLKDDKWLWYFQDILFPFLATAVIVMTGRYFLNENWPPLAKGFYIGTILGLAFVAAISILPQLRGFVLERIHNIRLVKQPTVDMKL